MTKRVCSTPGCPVLVDKGRTRCTKCSREQDRARGTREDRGYGSEHIAARAEWEPYVRTGYVKCRRCRLPIAPDQLWDLGHPDAACTRPRAPEHRHTADCPEGGNRATSRHRITG